MLESIYDILVISNINLLRQYFYDAPVMSNVNTNFDLSEIDGLAVDYSK